MVRKKVKNYHAIGINLVDTWVSGATLCLPGL